MKPPLKRFCVIAAAVGAVALLCAQTPSAPATDPVLQAMRDEVERSRQLQVSGLEKPYFIQYVIDDADTYSVSATLGGMLSRRRDKSRVPQVQVRVGDYTFDNTNFGQTMGTRYALGALPVENSYPVLRRYLWLQTDQAYKTAVDAISRKRAALRNITQNEQLNDFAHAEPVRSVGSFASLKIDEELWAGRVRSLSAIFTKFPEIANSIVDFEASDGGYYVANSEGTAVKAAENIASIRARAVAQASDGMNVRDAVVFYAAEAANLPPEAEMNNGIVEVARNVSALAKAPRGEDYTGPVLFEGVAGPQILAELLARNLVASRRPVGGGGRGGAASSEFEGRIGARVLPDTFEVTDDPLRTEWAGHSLFGSYEVDREGVVPKPLRLVEKGVLKTFLMTRQPVRGFEGSNGHARFPASAGGSGAAIGNLFVSSSETVPVAELKSRLIELIKMRDKPYGLLIRKMDFPASGGTAQSGLMGQPGARQVSTPILTYRVYPDGREELVRGLRFRGMNARSLRDILAAGDDSRAFDFLNGIGGNYTAASCVVAPSLLIDDLDLAASEEELPKLPIVPAPGFTP